jgi:hypothetical protein
LDWISIDVGQVLQRSVTSLYSNLVTRPTGRAVRYAIESQLEEVRRPALSVIDLSEVTLLDFSCADEVVAKLLLRYLAEDRPGEAFFVVGGVGDVHRHAIEAVLERHTLAVVTQESGGRFELIGPASDAEGRVWQVVEERGRIASEEIEEVFPSTDDRDALATLEQRRLVYRTREGRFVHAFSALMRGLL